MIEVKNYQTAEEMLLASLELKKKFFPDRRQWVIAAPPVAPALPPEPPASPIVPIVPPVLPEPAEDRVGFTGPRISSILTVCARYFDIPRGQLLSRRRTHDIVHPRQIAIYIARTMTDCSLLHLGRLFGGYDHTTILHAIQITKKRMDADEAIAATVNEIMADVRRFCGIKEEGNGTNT